MASMISCFVLYVFRKNSTFAASLVKRNPSQMVKQNSKKTASLVKKKKTEEEKEKKQSLRVYQNSKMTTSLVTKTHTLVWLKENLLLTTILVKRRQSCQVKQTLTFKSRKADWVTGEDQPITESDGVKQQIYPQP